MLKEETRENYISSKIDVKFTYNERKDETYDGDWDLDVPDWHDDDFESDEKASSAFQKEREASHNDRSTNCSICQSIQPLQFKQHLEQFHSGLNNCAVCNESFSSSDLYEKHMRDHIVGVRHIHDKVTCDLCGITKRFTGCERHMQNDHIKGRSKSLFKCNQCKKNFKRAIYLNDHKFKEHGGDAFYNCIKCDKGFTVRDRYLGHEACCKALGPDEASSFPEPLIKNNKFECTLCKKTFSIRLTWIVHHYNKHTQKNMQRRPRARASFRTFECPVCFKSFSSKGMMLEHRAKTHKTEIYCCRYCIETFTTHQTVLDHVARKHNSWDVEVPHIANLMPCYICNLVFRRQTHKDRHIDTDHADYIGRDCLLCNRKLIKGPRQFEKHMKHHFDTNFISCHYCGKMYDKNTIKSHIKIVHEFEAATCDVCGFRCSKYNMKNHMNCHSRLREQVRCQCCAKVFKGQASLVTHMINEHDAVPRFKCQYCSKGYSYTQPLKKHEIQCVTGVPVKRGRPRNS